MPMHYLRALTSAHRTDISNRRLGRALAFVAGAVNAGGFFAVGQYTSHMSGIVSALADNAALGDMGLLLAGAASLFAFFLGAATSAILINWGRRRGAHSRYALPLMVESALLLVFGLMGSRLAEHGHLPATVALLCFVMGLQNAIVTKVSRAEIRTTHVTGLVTDIGIELGKLFYWNVDSAGTAGRRSSPTATGYPCYVPCWALSCSAAWLARSASNIWALSPPSPWPWWCCRSPSFPFSTIFTPPAGD